VLSRETKECDSPLHPPMIAEHQNQDRKMETSMLKTKTEDYTTKMVQGVELIQFVCKI
jgi:hypothetical protein